MTRHGRTQGCAILGRVSGTEREGFARVRATEVAAGERGVVKGRGHPRAGGRAQLSGRSSERSARETRKKARRKRVASVFDSRYSPMRRAPTTGDLHHLCLATARKKRRERQNERNSRWSERGVERQGSLGTVWCLQTSSRRRSAKVEPREHSLVSRSLLVAAVGIREGHEHERRTT